MTRSRPFSPAARDPSGRTPSLSNQRAARLVGAEGFNRLVAAKRLHPQFTDDPDFVAMFHDEARIASRIHHPNVVPVLDVVTSGQEVILVQEYVHGVPLDSSHGFAGDRFFPATIATDDPFVADEMSLPTVTRNPTGPDGSQEIDIGAAIAKRLTPDIGIQLGGEPVVFHAAVLLPEAEVEHAVAA